MPLERYHMGFPQGMLMHTEWTQNDATVGLAGRDYSSLALRLRGAALVTACSAVLMTAALLTPRAGGHGTHEELGLPACSFLARTGYPCPSCGLTTSVSAAVHGRFIYAFNAHPFGLLLVAGLLILTFTGMLELVYGRGFVRRLRPGPWWAVGAYAGMLLGWGWKLLAGMASGKYPLH